jgi:hypothetical protein
MLQAADQAIGASKVKSSVISATGWMGYPGQQFAQGDLPRTDLKSYVRTVDYDSKSAKTEYVRVQGNNGIRGGGAGVPVQGEQHFTQFASASFGGSRGRFWSWSRGCTSVAIPDHRRSCGWRSTRFARQPAAAPCI